MAWREASPDMAGLADDLPDKIEQMEEKCGKGGYLYNWEVLLDAKLSLNNGEKCQPNFTRVYIDDSDLVNMGADDLLAQKVQELGIVDDNKRRKFIEKLRKLGYVTGYNPFGSRDSTSPKNIVEVSFEEYKPSFGRVLARYSLQDNGSPSPSSLSPPALSPILGNSRSSSSSPISITETPHKRTPQKDDRTPSTASNEGDRPFDWNFDPVRDAELVACEANTHMRRDRGVMKYWFQRFRLFSKLKDGILLDRESWFSVTPERLAEHIADRMVREQDCVILDAFSGAGGNAIQFAKFGAYVYAVDVDPIKLRCASRNAEIYGVADRISFICADFFQVAKLLRNKVAENPKANEFKKIFVDPHTLESVSEWANIDAVFLSPPWGGPAYLQSREFDLDKHMEPKPGTEIYDVAKQISPDICYFLPRNTKVNQIIDLDRAVEVEQAVLNGKVKTINAYFGRLIAAE